MEFVKSLNRTRKHTSNINNSNREKHLKKEFLDTREVCIVHYGKNGFTILGNLLQNGTFVSAESRETA